MLADPAAERGVENVVSRCLRVMQGERVALLFYRAGALVEAFEAAIERAGANVTRLDLEARPSILPSSPTGSAAGASSVGLRRALDGAAASVLVADESLPMGLSYTVRDEAQKARARHIHLTGVDPRVLAQSGRAEPDRLALVGQRVVERLSTASRVTVTSSSGTSLEIQLTSALPLLVGTGRPDAGASENVPAGFVYFHPADVRGVFVADRAIALSGQRVPTRRTPVTLVIDGGRVRERRCEDAATLAALDAYLESHHHAGRVGTLVLPTNYLVRSEIGVYAQDELAPGINVNLGFTHHVATLAPWDAPVQARLLARKLTVRAGDRALVDQGRHVDALVEGIDPFR
jgi:leucyl aminopeptidase (aminopeptidase T)